MFVSTRGYRKDRTTLGVVARPKPTVSLALSGIVAVLVAIFGGYGLPRIVSSVLSVCLSFAVAVSTSHANPVDEIIDTAVKSDQASARTQQRINRLDDETQSLLDDYRNTVQQLESLTIYNGQLERLLQSQLKEASSLEAQIAAIDVTDKELTPLMIRMVTTLERFISLDIPFLPQERDERISRLKAHMDRADLSLAEKFRQITEAYQIESDYGRTIEAYRAELKSLGTENTAEARTVDFLRLGRVGLFYQTLDGAEQGYWNVQAQQWQPLDDDFRAEVNKGLRIARKQAAPDLLVLPVAKPVAANTFSGEASDLISIGTSD